VGQGLAVNKDDVLTVARLQKRAGITTFHSCSVSKKERSALNAYVMYANLHPVDDVSSRLAASE